MTGSGHFIKRLYISPSFTSRDVGNDMATDSCNPRHFGLAARPEKAFYQSGGACSDFRGPTSARILARQNGLQMAGIDTSGISAKVVELETRFNFTLVEHIHVAMRNDVDSIPLHESVSTSKRSLPFPAPSHWIDTPFTADIVVSGEVRDRLSFDPSLRPARLGRLRCHFTATTKTKTGRIGLNHVQRCHCGLGTRLVTRKEPFGFSGDLAFGRAIVRGNRRGLPTSAHAESRRVRTVAVASMNPNLRDRHTAGLAVARFVSASEGVDSTVGAKAGRLIVRHSGSPIQSRGASVPTGVPPPRRRIASFDYSRNPRRYGVFGSLVPVMQSRDAVNADVLRRYGGGA